MYTIGEFSKVAQVSRRLLRYYAQIGLLKPVNVDPATGYRYYSVSQLPTLNRILALKELGLSLEQIQRLIASDVSLEEIQGMLTMKKAELEQQLLDDLRRVRVIESRLRQIHQHADLARDVIVKQVPQQYLLGFRRTFATFEVGANFFGALIQALPVSTGIDYGPFAGVVHADGLDGELIDLEAGRTMQQSSHPGFTIRHSEGVDRKSE